MKMRAGQVVFIYKLILVLLFYVLQKLFDLKKGFF
ncbi:hypothetical protein D3839_01135 [Streptococcus mutans]|nr:hypothetical protein [Streptococcus mutans]NLQ90974.1 hypothetical protein [Streptococcus mutans]NLQ96960.1 hypothetical protein [Streptococcus mutans]PNM01426.1 hypothetical protein A6J86_008655 [Streptococcus mutans]